MSEHVKQGIGELVAEIPSPRGAIRVRRAASFFERAKGLLGTSAFPDGFDGLYFERCNGVHTLGMRYPIDVVFVDGGLRVVLVRSYVRPYTPLIMCRQAVAVLELQAGDGAAFILGQRLALTFIP